MVFKFSKNVYFAIVWNQILTTEESLKTGVILGPPLIAERWTTDSDKNFFGQIIVSDVRTFQSTLKMQIFDLCTSPNASLFNGQIP